MGFAGPAGGLGQHLVGCPGFPGGDPSEQLFGFCLCGRIHRRGLPRAASVGLPHGRRSNLFLGEVPANIAGTINAPRPEAKKRTNSGRIVADLPQPLWASRPSAGAMWRFDFDEGPEDVSSVGFISGSGFSPGAEAFGRNGSETMREMLGRPNRVPQVTAV